MRLFDLAEAKKRIKELEERNINLEHEHYLDDVRYHNLNKEYEEAEEENRLLKEQVKKLTKQLNEEELKGLASDKTIGEMKNKVELLELKLKDTKELLEEYKALPDLQNMINNLSSLTTPSIDKLVEVIEKTNFGDDEEKLSGIENKLESIRCTLDYFSHSSRFR